jgi:hypothetical protein
MGACEHDRAIDDVTVAPFQERGRAPTDRTSDREVVVSVVAEALDISNFSVAAFAKSLPRARDLLYSTRKVEAPSVRCAASLTRSTGEAQ